MTQQVNQGRLVEIVDLSVTLWFHTPEKLMHSKQSLGDRLRAPNNQQGKGKLEVDLIDALPI